jgi:hypothetical protein
MKTRILGDNHWTYNRRFRPVEAGVDLPILEFSGLISHALEHP